VLVCPVLLISREDFAKPETPPSRDSAETDLAIGIVN
jgi:hypothetical protein